MSREIGGQDPEQEAEPQPQLLSQYEQVGGLLSELTPQLEGVRGPLARDVWRFTRAWLQEQDLDNKKEIYDRLSTDLRMLILRVQQFAVIGEMPENEDADYQALYETLLRLALALDVPVDDLI